ncbi:MAG: hypothetical protein MJA29_14375, partial [Candidatus Omnitrophica bacterium]|nr:hypothetical protein [Candidatus Omnitrophota bacterium]
YLGLLVNIPKSELVAGQEREYIGMLFLFHQGLAVAPSRRLDSIEALIRTILEGKGATARQWASLIGKLGSLSDVIRLGALHRRPFQRFLLTNWDQKSDNWERFLPFPNSLVAHLEWWMDRGNTAQGVPLGAFRPDLTLFTDASLWGWGATLNQSAVSQPWCQADALRHSNVREMLAVIRAVEWFSRLLQGQKTLICSDNRATIANINKQGSVKAWGLTDLAWDFWSLVDGLGMDVQARFIPGHLNVAADQCSRGNQTISTEWSIDPAVLTAIWSSWGTPDVDLFATRWNRKLAKFVSPVPDNLAWKVNALTFSWEGMFVYAFPPWKILQDVLMKIKEERVTAILIAPYWPYRPWFPLLLELATVPPIALGFRTGLLFQELSGAECQDLELLNLHAWKLCGAG